MTGKYKLGAEYNLIQQPLLYPLQQGMIRHSFDVQRMKPDEILQGLVNGDLAAGLITPLQYARESINLSLSQDIAIFSAGACSWAGLLMRENLQQLDRFAALADSGLYRSLAEILFRESYEVDLDWDLLEKAPALEEALADYPAKLFSGEAALEAAGRSDKLVDLTEIWWEKTDSAFFHYVLAVPRESEAPLPVEELRLARSLGISNLNKIARTYAEADASENGWIYYFEKLQNGFSLEAAPAYWEGVRLYFEFLFYHGQIEHIPELHFI